MATPESARQDSQRGAEVLSDMGTVRGNGPQLQTSARPAEADGVESVFSARGPINTENRNRNSKKFKNIMPGFGKGVVDNQTVRCGDLIEYLEHSVSLTEGWKSLPLTICFFLVFVLSVLLHAELGNTFNTENALRTAVAEAVYKDDRVLADVTEATEFWPWMNDALVSLGWARTPAREDEPFGRIGVYNQIVGSVFLEQVRSKLHDCDVPLLQLFYGHQCHPSDTVSTRMFNTTAIPEDDEFLLSAFTAARKKHANDVFEARFNVYDNITYVKSGLLRLQAAGWVDKSTREVTVRTLLYNGEMSMLAQLRVTFGFERSGIVSTYVQLATTPADFYKHWWQWAIDVAWLVALAMLTTSEIVDMCRQRKSFTLSYFSDKWNVLDWLCICWGFALSGMFIFLVLEVGESVDELRHVPDRLSEDYSEYLSNMERNLGNRLDFSRLLAALAGSFFFLLILRFFKSFRAQPRLAIVTRTLSVAGVDFLHFVVILGTVWACYVFSGHLVFGQSTPEFSTLRSAGQITLLTLQGEAAFWGLIKDTQYVFASIWFWTYMILVFMILLNMFIAVLIDTYTQVKSSASSMAPTLWSQTYDAFTKHRKILRGRLTYEDMIEKLRVLDQDEILVPETLAQSLDIPKTHARIIIKAAVKFVKALSKKKGGVSLSDALKSIHRLNESITVSTERLQQLEHSRQQQDKMIQDINVLVDLLLEKQEDRSGSSKAGAVMEGDEEDDGDEEGMGLAS